VTSSLVTVLRAGDEQVAPLVCVHSVSGRADDYQLLAAALDWPGPVLGISAPSEPGELTDLASRYCDELDLRMPVLLLGWSLGGAIAAELSRTIVARGGEVRFLGLLDSRASQPEMRKRPVDRDALARFYLQHAALIRERPPVEPPATTESSQLLAALRVIGVDDIAEEAELERRLQTFMGLIRAFYRHEQRPVPVTICLFETAEAHPSHPRPPTLGWDDLAPSIERHHVAGTHFTLMAPRHIEALAKTIGRGLPRSAQRLEIEP
jgi:thioesterase domain-containing protein